MTWDHVIPQHLTTYQDSGVSQCTDPNVGIMTPDDSSTTELCGWGRTTHKHTRVRRPDTHGGVVDAILAEPEVTIRGAGKSYGDAALPGQGSCST